MTRDTQRKVLILAGALLVALMGIIGVVRHYMEDAAFTAWWNAPTKPSPEPPKPRHVKFTALQKDGVALPLTYPGSKDNKPPGTDSPAGRQNGSGPVSYAPSRNTVVLPLDYETPNPWYALDKFQGTLTRAEFEQHIKELYDPFGALPQFVDINDERLVVYPDPKFRDIPQYTLRFAAAPDSRKTWTRPFRSPAEFRAIPKPDGKPLQGLRIAIDPGHIGGDWAQIEERCTRYRGSAFVKEGDLNLITANILRRELTELGATVYLVREANEPVTPYRPIDFLDEARRRLVDESKGKTAARLLGMTPEQQTKSLGARKVTLLSEFLFYRSSEILERGSRIRNNFQPDITITLYINATPGSKGGGTTNLNRNIFFVHGSYTKEEVQDARQRLRMIHKIMEGGLDIEVEVADKIAQIFKRVTNIPPVLYGNSATTRRVNDNPYVVARNLAANREYDGPVVCTEPYFMNEINTYPRLLAGDYDGERKFNGKTFKSIFREYADCVVEGLVTAYGPPPKPDMQVVAGKPQDANATAGN